MRQRVASVVVLAVVVLGAAACGDDDASGGTAAGGGTATEPSAAPTTAPRAPAAEPADGGGAATGGLAVATTSLGEVVVDAEGRTVYLFLPDERGDSTCYDQCEANWPPVAEVGGVGGELDGALLGSTTRTDGTVQATYGGWPLYLFAGDSTPGDVSGQGLNGVWYAIDAAGEAVGVATGAAGPPSY